MTEIYQIEYYEHLRKKSRWEPVEAVIKGPFSENIESSTNTPRHIGEIDFNPEHPYIENLKQDDVIGF